MSVIWQDNNGHSPLYDFFNAVYPLNKEAQFFIDRDTFPLELKRGELLVKPGVGSENLYLVCKGVVRGYIKQSGKEITTWINEENEIVGAISNLGFSLPYEEYLQAVEDSFLIAIPYTLIDYLYEHYPEANTIGRKLLEDNYRGAEERAYICRLPSARKRYQHFMSTQPGLINRISLKYIASYLGITQETLSRVRSRK